MDAIMLGNPKVEVPGLIEALLDSDPEVRQDARVSLIMYGKVAVCPLIAALNWPNSDLRLMIVEILGKIHNPSAVPALVEVLQDKNCDLRHAAAENLIAFRQHSVRPLLNALAEDAQSVWLREGAHKVLLALKELDFLDEGGQLVLDALRSDLPETAASPAARTALEMMCQ
ncbi:MAG: HEAT repeat domain-containing protein [Anaerolineaceae bacterium]|nr:HEAT repeat domain-containing protein [Anaerolineaceae bacterium]